MKCILVIVFASLMASAFAATSIGFYPHKDYPGKCVISKSLIISGGDTLKDPFVPCGEIFCTGNQEGQTIFNTCGAMSVPSCHSKPADGKLNYPLCCTALPECDN